MTRSAQKRGGLKRDLVPVMALLGAVYGWLVAVVAVIIAATVFLVG